MDQTGITQHVSEIHFFLQGYKICRNNITNMMRHQLLEHSRQDIKKQRLNIHKAPRGHSQHSRHLNRVRQRADRKIATAQIGPHCRSQTSQLGGGKWMPLRTLQHNSSPDASCYQCSVSNTAIHSSGMSVHHNACSSKHLLVSATMFQAEEWEALLLVCLSGRRNLRCASHCSAKLPFCAD